MIAHRRESDGKTQGLKEHCENVSRLSALSADKMGLSALASFIGLLHDLGKGTDDFNNYLLGTGKKHPNHAGLGALYVWKRWGEAESSIGKRRAAQLISLCIYGHHAGLPDCVNEYGDSPFLDGLRNQSEDYYREATENFHIGVASEEKLERMFCDAYEELKKLNFTDKAFSWGMLARLLLSILIDTDRWDSACFERDADPFAESRENIPDWGELLNKLENYIGKFNNDGMLNETRRNISECCKAAGEREPGIYTLSVPTGGGKTYSSLRFALAHAKKYSRQRILYVIPMNTVLDQNAKDITKALDDYPSILVHHSNVVIEDETEAVQHRRLTERWDSDIILTSLVQFLEALFKNGNGKARRMHRLVNSVIIFDEIQALPKKCRGLFESAVKFLVDCCNCTVLLCTATQPNLKLESVELIPNAEELYGKLKRVKYIPQLQARTYQAAADDIAAMIRDNTSILTVVNTKAAAWNIYQRIAAQLGGSCELVKIKQGLSDEEIKTAASNSGNNELLLVHLSTLMCPAHRATIIDWLKAWLGEGKRVCCISTALIEAGINISFPVTVRSLAGIPSIIQAGGRCNRNFEAKCGYVYLWNLPEERLSTLRDIQKGREITLSLLDNGNNPDKLGSAELIRNYFAKEENYTKETENYPYKKRNTDLVTMLSRNNTCEVKEDVGKLLSKRLRQSFRTAGDEFRVIDGQTKSVIVPYGKGAELIDRLTSNHSLKDEILYLKQAQHYSVSLFENIFNRLANDGALFPIGDTGAVGLRREYYDDYAGVITTPKELEELVW